MFKNLYEYMTNNGLYNEIMNVHYRIKNAFCHPTYKSLLIIYKENILV